MRYLCIGLFYTVINLLRFIFVFSADIDDLKICYVLKHKNNATSDTFFFYVEDNGKFANWLKKFLFVCLSF